MAEPRCTKRHPPLTQLFMDGGIVVIAKLCPAARTDEVIDRRARQLTIAADWALIDHFLHCALKYWK